MVNLIRSKKTWKIGHACMANWINTTGVGGG